MYRHTHIHKYTEKATQVEAHSYLKPRLKLRKQSWKQVMGVKDTIKQVSSQGSGLYFQRELQSLSFCFVEFS